MALQIAPHKVVIGADADCRGGGASWPDGGAAILLDQRQYGHNAAYCGLAVFLMHAAAERPDLLASFVGARQQLQSGQRSLLGPVLVFDAMASTRLAQVFAQELSGLRVHQTDLVRIPLHLNAPADPPRRCAIVCRPDPHPAFPIPHAFTLPSLA